MIKNNYNSTQAKRWRDVNKSSEADKDLGERVYTSQLIGKNPDLVMHGGGIHQLKLSEGIFLENWKECYMLKALGGI